MPLPDRLRNEAIAYADAHLINEAKTREGFSFIDNPALVDLIFLELKSARYVYRLMEMLDLKDTFSHPFCKFQIVQYAGIFEAAIDHLIFEKVYKSHAAQVKVEKIRENLQRHETLITVSALSKEARIIYRGEEAFVASLKTSKKSRQNIKFEDMVKSMTLLSLIDEKLGVEINDFYKKRHSVHLTAKIKSAITVELSDTKRGFRRINAFCENVKRGLKKLGEPI